MALWMSASATKEGRLVAGGLCSIGTGGAGADGSARFSFCAEGGGAAEEGAEGGGAAVGTEYPSDLAAPPLFTAPNWNSSAAGTAPPRLA